MLMSDYIINIPYRDFLDKLENTGYLVGEVVQLTKIDFMVLMSIQIRECGPQKINCMVLKNLLHKIIIF